MGMFARVRQTDQSPQMTPSAGFSEFSAPESEYATPIVDRKPVRVSKIVVKLPRLGLAIRRLVIDRAPQAVQRALRIA